MKIEAGIPIPKKRNNARSKWWDTAMSMKQGDSILTRTKGAANALAFVIRYHAGRATVAKEESGGYRVWRIV
jgi:hypothetical protein